MRYNAKQLLLAFVASCLLAGLGSSQLFAQGGITLDFSTDPEDLGVFFVGDAEWRTDGGVDDTGYLKVTDAENGQSGAIVFPELTPGDALESFQITADLRVGGGTARPADGFSFNLVRPDDPLLADGTGYASSPANEANLPEEGSTTGLGIGFDEWQSGPEDPEATAEDCGDFVAFDCVGMSVRVDNELVAQIPFPTLNGELDDQTSLQTGPQGDVEDLGWAQLVIQVTPDTTDEARNNLFISYKDREVFNESIAYQTTPGQLVFGGRTGGANANHHIDNISVIFDFTGGVQGDFNADGVVDLADFAILRDNMYTSGIDVGLAQGDIDFNKRVNIADFAQFRQAYAAAQPAGAAVPEPATGLLAGIGALALAAIRRRRSA